jgi:quercetin dioxygenase-like cupin family protein
VKAAQPGSNLAAKAAMLATNFKHISKGEEAMPTRALRLLLAAPVLAFAPISTACAVELNPAALVYRQADDIKLSAPLPTGSQNAVLVGDPSKPGLYVVLNKWLKGNHFSRPHSHPGDRFIMVLGGTWWQGTGTTFDPDNSMPLRAGTFVTHHAKQIHWDGAKEEDATLLIFGEGPGTSSRAAETPGKLGGLDAKAVTYTLPEQYKWRDPTGAAGTNQVVLAGDPTKPGPYVVLNRFKPGNFSKPHFHPNDRFITVVKGTWWVATGNKVDMENMVPMRTGAFVTHFGKQVHWDGAKNEEAWVLIVGDGPATSTRVEEAR